MNNLDVYDIQLNISLPPIRVLAEDEEDAVNRFYEQLFDENDELYKLYFHKRLEDREMEYTDAYVFGDYGIRIDDLLGDKDAK